MGIERIKEMIRVVPDFPQKGILFRDLTTVFKDPKCLKDLSELMSSEYEGKGITKVVGIESRGFIMGPVIANAVGAGFVTLRKPGKLPAETIQASYQKEYGIDTIEIHKDALTPDDVVLIHDDLLATGGTLPAAYDLVTSFGVNKIYINFIVELEGLHGRNLFPAGVEVDSFINY